MRLILFLFLNGIISLNADIFSDIYTQDEINKAKGGASSLANDIKTHNSNLEKNIFNPVSGGGKVTTLDGSKSAVANLTCNDNNHPFLIVSYSGNNNIDISIKIDTNTDGTIDKTTTIAGVSGISTNGVVKCDNGTWNNCNYYSWNIDTSSNISLSPINRNSLNGLYCINSSCGGISSSSKDRILNDIAGGLANKMQSVNSNYIISTIKTDDSNSINVFGQNYQDCSNTSTSAKDNASSGIPTSSTLSNDASAMQVDDENSTYSILLKSSNNEYKDTQDIQTISNTKLDSVNVDENDPHNISYSVDGDTINATVMFDENPKIQSCTVQWIETDNQVNSDDDLARDKALNQTIKTKVKECIGDDYSECPLDSGESIKYDCGTVNNSLGEVSAGFESVNEVTKDFSCSSI